MWRSTSSQCLKVDGKPQKRNQSKILNRKNVGQNFHLPNGWNLWHWGMILFAIMSCLDAFQKNVTFGEVCPLIWKIKTTSAHWWIRSLVLKWSSEACQSDHQYRHCSQVCSIYPSRAHPFPSCFHLVSPTGSVWATSTTDKGLGWFTQGFSEICGNGGVAKTVIRGVVVSICSAWCHLSA